MARSEDFDESLVQLIAEHQTALRGFVMAMMPGSPDVDDVVQEVNALVWRKRGEFVPGTNFKAWMLTVARFQVLNAWRRQKNRKESHVPEEVLNRLVDQGIESAAKRDQPRKEVLWECIDGLRPVDRALILSRYFDGRKVKELAAEVGRSAESVKVSLHRIRTLLAMCVRRRLHLREECP
ncbi:DNA-directed RNA polymerase sigma-70 factor [Haloferula helveola]|uniref:DNA-directed RNA polymerase sigma-70 factor n=1 Tax=Haloferula helveola TaxID=490095 RepID=A0ABN6H4R3_9BACT|nr:DNA-directed RNA polymerase sigma-70 factor [Haloferula helveola]